MAIISGSITDGSDTIWADGEADFIDLLAGDDFINSGEGNDFIDGGDGNDILLGGEGNDWLIGEEENDFLNGENGNDLLVGNEGDDTLYGGNGDDLLSGWEGNNLLYGEGGNDFLLGGENNDILYGGDGDDILGGSSNGIDTDLLIGEGGNDTYYIASSIGNVIVEFADGGGIDTIRTFIDYSLGDNLENLILENSFPSFASLAFNGYGNSLNNSIQGNDFNNYLQGDAGNDTLTGGIGSDILDGGGEIDQLVESGDFNYTLTDTNLTTSSSATVFKSANTPLNIPNDMTITSSLTVNGLVGLISDVNVNLNIFHTFNSDLDVFLISPLGTRVELFTDVGGGGEHFLDTTLDDETLTPISYGFAPFAGSFQPEGLLSTFDGQNPNGTWQLEITDKWGADVGTLYNWSLSFGQTSPVIDTLNSIEQANLTGGDDSNLLDASAFDLGAVTLDGGSRHDTLIGGTGNDYLYGGNELIAQDYYVYNGHTYFLSQAGTWQEAQVEAQAFGGNLVTINDATEQEWLYNTFGASDLFWIGYTDKYAEGYWQWINGESITYTNWSPGEPNDAEGGEEYAVMGWHNYAWNDLGNLGLGGLGYKGIIEIPFASTVPQILGNDSLNGGLGNDILVGGDGNDTLTGGAGFDLFHYLAPSNGGDIITDFQTQGEFDQFYLLSSNFAGLNFGQLESNQFSRGNTVQEASTAALMANGGQSGAAMLVITSGTDVQVYYDPLTSSDTFGEETLLATVLNQSITNISEVYFTIV